MSRFSLRLARESTKPNASKCGKWLVAASTSSWRSTCICSTSAPSSRHRRSTTAKAAGSVCARGVRITLCRRNNCALDASTPLCSEPAIGWPGTKRAGMPPKACCAARTTLPLALPTSVRIAWPRSMPASTVSNFSMARIGTASWITSAPWHASARSASQRSTTPNSTANLRDCGSRSTPTTSPHNPLSRRPLAKEPPIKPRPTTTRRPIIGTAGCNAVTSTTSQNLGQRLQEATVLSWQTDGDAQVVRHAVVGHRTHDHAFAQQALEHRGRHLAEIDADEVALGRNPAQAQLTKAGLQLQHAAFVDATPFFQVLGILQRRTGRREGEAVDVERLAHTVEHVGHHRRRQAVADAQRCQAISLGERARNQQVRVGREEIQAVGHVAAFGVLDVD